MKRIYDTIYLESTDSTNNEAKKRPTSDNLAVIASYEQTAGRGQRGNTWHSTPGLNLTFSILVRWGRDDVPAIKATDQFAVSRIITVALIDFLASKGIDAGIKWPNDIYVRDRKICGILIENSVNGLWLSSSVIGIGLNINEKDFPSGIPNPTSMLLESGVSFDTAICLDEYICHFDNSLALYGTQEGRAELENRYLYKMYRKDKPHQFLDLRNTESGSRPVATYLQGGRDKAPGRQFTGTIRGVSPTACLLVENEEGELHRFAFKEIAYII